MVLSGVGLAFGLLLSSIVAAATALYGAAWLGPESRRAQRADHRVQTEAENIAFLFEDASLVDATRAAERLIAAAPPNLSDWSRLLTLLAAEFPEFEHRVEMLAVDGVQTYTSRDGSTRLTAEWRNGLCRVTLVDEDVDVPTADIDAQSYAALERELEYLRANTQVAPYPVWRQDAQGRIVWVNQCYLDALKRLRGPEAAGRWPTPALFDVLAVSENEGKHEPLRIALDASGDEAWYDIDVSRVDDQLVCTAIDISAAVDAKRQLRGFTQTLTKTFADLAVGLAIFDRSRRLVMFNPALSDLSELPFGFLAANPTLHGFLDRMRDLGRVPEPRNYSEWRKQMADLESSASGGHFSETWTLANGQTLRVTGRPHPDGALAFIFEDISAEISLTRRFRAELEASRSVFDHFDEAVAVFSTAGVLTMANTAYADLWGHSPMSGVNQVDLTDAARLWADRSVPSQVWERAADFIHTGGSRTPWTTDVTLRDGRSVTCRFVPLNGGSTLVGFTPQVPSSGDLTFRRHAG